MKDVCDGGGEDSVEDSGEGVGEKLGVKREHSQCHLQNYRLIKISCSS